MNPTMRAVLVRLGITFILSAVFAFAISEVSYQLVKDQSDRQPQEVEIIIPAGTAAALAAGEPGPAFPDMTFVEGDQLVLRNLDSVSHQLGPLWVPPNTSSVMVLDRPNAYSLACSFQPSQKLDLDVLPRAKNSDRVFGIFSVGAPTWILAWLYSLIGIPLPGADQKGSSDAA
jgi:hypothetical protein